MIKFLALFQILFLLSTIEGYSQANGWELKKDQNGIKVFVRDSEESSFDEFKATLTITNCRLQDALEVLQDVNSYEAWFPDCSNPKILKQIDEYHDIHYIESISPWPVQNRWGIYEQTALLTLNNTKVEIVFKALPDYPKEVSNMVRIKEAHGKWTLIETNNELNVIYEFKGNPEGDIPSWIANAFVVKHPFETLTNFKKHLKELGK